MNNLSPSFAGAPFALPLQRARVRQALRGSAIALLWAAAAALVCLRFGPGLALPVDWTILAGAMVVGIGGVGTGLAWWRAPGLPELAARADRRFLLGERLSTAIGLEPEAQGWRGVIAQALRRDAAQRAGEVKPNALAPLAGWGLGIAALALVGAGLAFWTPSDVVAPPASREMVAMPVDAAARAQNLGTIAEVIRADAEIRQNDYLKAVAEAVERLAQGPDQPMSDTQYNEALTGLLDHARLAYGKALPAWLRGDAAAPGDPFHLAADQAFNTLAGNAVGQADDGKGGGGEELVPETFAERGLLPDRPQQPPAGGFKLAPADEIGDLAISNQSIGGSAEAPSGGVKAASGGAAPTMGQGDPGTIELNGASGLALGASAQSSAGASRVAGSGTQAVADERREEAAPIRIDDQVMLAADDYRQGKRLRIQIAPQTEERGDLGSGDGRPLSGTGASTPVARDTPSVHDQAAFARYFTRGEAL